jgi:hypothetical protein
LSILSLRLGRLAAVAAALAGPVAARAQQPFSVGERAEYDVKYGIVHAGTGSLSVVGVDTVRQRDAYRFRMTLSAQVNLLLYRYTFRDTMQSWADTASFHSLRFTQDQHDRGGLRVKRYEIFPERSTYSDNGKPEQGSVANPLDDISFLFFVRTQALEAGTTREFGRYFKPDKNPLILKVLRRDTIEAAGKKWPTIVVQPIIKTSTIFGNGEGRVWISDDSARIIVQINLKLSIGSINMKLRSYQPGVDVDSPPM